MDPRAVMRNPGVSVFVTLHSAKGPGVLHDMFTLLVGEIDTVPGVAGALR
ncbi:MAG: hypothetical protein JNM17_37050 [Archangium sp.]|nr:hypothetical protein [Archangium sp.]